MDFHIGLGVLLGIVIGAGITMVITVLIADLKEMEGWFSDEGEGEVSEGHNAD